MRQAPRRAGTSPAVQAFARLTRWPLLDPAARARLNRILDDVAEDNAALVRERDAAVAAAAAAQAEAGDLRAELALRDGVIAEHPDASQALVLRLMMSRHLAGQPHPREAL